MRDVFHPLRPALDPPPSLLPQSWLTRLAGRRVDVIPWNVDLVYANKLHYWPRPVMQTYQVTDAYLDSLNAAFYESNHAPDYVVFSWNSIDNRDPMADESLTKLALLQRYQVDDQWGDWMLLHHRAVPLNKQVLSRTLQQAAINTFIPVDTLIKGLQLWQIDGAYTLLGYGQRTLFQPPGVLLELTDQTGAVQTFRTALPLLNSGLILPVHPANLTGMGQFLRSGAKRGDAKVVKLRILANDRFVQTNLRIRSQILSFSEPPPQLLQAVTGQQRASESDKPNHD